MDAGCTIVTNRQSQTQQKPQYRSGDGKNKKRGTGIEPVTLRAAIERSTTELPARRILLYPPQITNASYKPYTVHTLQFATRHDNSYPNAPLKASYNFVAAARTDE